MLRFEGLSKAYAGRRVIDAITGQLGPGAYALQGPNGVGKSTLLALFAGAIAPDAGEVWIEGLSLQAAPVEARKRLGYAPDTSSIYPFITGRDFLDFVVQTRKYDGCRSMEEMIDELGLTPYLAGRFSAMSLGTQKKYLLCAAWIGDAAVLLLDEPSNGLDHAARTALARRIADRSQHALTLFASHDAAFVEACGATVVDIDEMAGLPSRDRRAG